MQVREVEVRYKRSDVKHDGRTRLLCSKHVARMFDPIVEGKIQESFWVVYLNAQHKPLGMTEVHKGTGAACPVSPSDAFRGAVVLGAKGVVFVHNHPSGNANPSPEDRHLTERLERAGEVLGIEVLDHVIVTGESDYYSFADAKAQGFAEI